MYVQTLFSSSAPITFGDWINSTNCRASGKNESCGQGQLDQTRVCIDGTHDRCESQDVNRAVNCSLPPCAKVFTDWKNTHPCLANGTNTTCGPGITTQERNCTDGTNDKCQLFELTRDVSCKLARNDLPDCEMILGEWENITNCVAVDKKKSCGNGTVVLKRDCTDGTKDLCTNFQNEKHVSCDEADISLPVCKGSLNEMIRIQK